MTTRIKFSEWERITEELRRFGEAGEVVTGDDWIRIDFGSAHVELSQEGSISTGMPLHEFEQEGVDNLVVDHDAGSLTIESDEMAYTFRRPGG